MPVVRYTCPLSTCGWTVDYASAGPATMRVIDPHLAAPRSLDDFLSAAADTASPKSLRALEELVTEHVGRHTPVEWARDVAAARTSINALGGDLEKARAWWGHWKRRAINVGARLGRALERHRPAMDGGGLPTGRCTCGDPHPCGTTRAAGPRRPSWEETCDCAPDCPASGGVTTDAPAGMADGAWGSVWLHGNWRWLTQNMTTEQREHAADAVARWDQGLADVDGEQGRPEPEGLRWWREDSGGPVSVPSPSAASSGYPGGPARLRPVASATAPSIGPGDGA